MIVPRRYRLLGPGMLVTAAFVGPGTVTTASAAGAAFGYALVWALLFSIVATAVLQDMAVRQALVTREGLATTLRRAFAQHWAGRVAMALVIGAIGIGNAAYESGNISGAALALSASGGSHGIWSLAIGAIAAALLFLPAYRHLERLLVLLVLMMSAVFALSALLLRPDWQALLRGATVPNIPAGSLTTVIALIGTTVVPYNLFLHSNAVRERWSRDAPLAMSLREARSDTLLSIGLGGLVTLAIVSTASTVYFYSGLAFAPATLPSQLEASLGASGRYLFIAGLFAAGLTSAITAPLAAAYAVCGALGWQDRMHGRAFRAVALAVVACGTVFAAAGTRPVSLIVFAQAANGLLLPLVALALLWIMNRKALLGELSNRWPSNLLGALVLAVTVGLGANRIASLFGG